MEWLLIILAIGAFLAIGKNYNPKEYQNIKVNFKQKLKGELKEHEAGLLVALLAKVSKADGQVDLLEAELISNTLDDIANTFEDFQNILETSKPANNTLPTISYQYIQQIKKSK